jgi:hypothetical protein
MGIFGIGKEKNNTPSKPSQQVVDLAEEYITAEHPLDQSSRLLGIERTKPKYKVMSDQVGRSSYAHIDMKIVSVASCLPGEDIAVNDTQKIARLAFKAIQHYASIPSVQAFFLAPFHFRGGTIANGSAIPRDEQCRLYAGVENLLLEIYDELPMGCNITDTLVIDKINQLRRKG